MAIKSIVFLDLHEQGTFKILTSSEFDSFLSNLTKPKETNQDQDRAAYINHILESDEWCRFVDELHNQTNPKEKTHV